MKLTPLYDAPNYVRFEAPLDDPSVPLLRQRRRLAATLADLDDARWASPTRCEGWSVQDVVAHLVTTNQFWAFSIKAGLKGEPTRFLTDFDPVASPAELVDAERAQPWERVLDRFVETNEAVADAVAGLDEDGWATLAEAPPGHIPIRGVAMHALWDSWIHERDIVLPLGLAPVEEDDEIAQSLRYAAVLSPAFAVAYGSAQRGAVVVDVTDPDLRVVVEVAEGIRVRDGAAPEGALHLTGSAVELLEGISYRAPLPQPVPDEHQWLFGGLGQVFDRGPRDS
jgi:uncharacterized protein (TIGR03083 family)